MTTASTTAKPKTALLIIDPQNDFVSPHGALSVAGAVEDAQRLAHFMEKMRSQIDTLCLSLDRHHRVDISHPLWFRDAHGTPPAPFTVIRSEDLRAQRWFTHENRYERTLAYLDELERRNRYPHVIWPEHCLIGSEGHAIYAPLYDEVLAWSAHHADHRHVDFVGKGENPWTEHFSAVEAEVPDESDPHTLVNYELIQNLLQADEVWVAGWARSHCVGNTVRDLIRYGGTPLASRMVLLSDTMSDVPGFEDVGEAFTKEVCAQGVSMKDCDQIRRLM